MSATAAGRLARIGDPRQGLEAARRAAREVPAYGRFLADGGVDAGRVSRGEVPWDALPVMDKKNYCLRYPAPDLMPAEHREAVSMFVSSAGTSGMPYYWPSLRPGYFAGSGSSSPLRRLLQPRRWAPAVEQSLALHRYDPLGAMLPRRTLAVVARTMGAWRGGSKVFLSISRLADRLPNLGVVPVGSRVDDILAAVLALHGRYEHVWVILIPSVLERLLDRASSEPAFPFAKCRFSVSSEVFPESLRLRASELCGKRFPAPAVDGIFASADTGVAGFESTASIGLRQLCDAQPGLCKALGLPFPPPNLYHPCTTTCLEEIEGELVFTKWRGIPLIRYNLHDRGLLLKWEDLRRQVADARVPKELEPLQKHIVGSPARPDLFAVQGRTDGVTLPGGFLYYYDDMNAAMHHPLLQKSTTGQFTVSPQKEAGSDPRLLWEIELRPEVEASPELEDVFYAALVQEMRRIYALFDHEYPRSYQKHERDPSARIFQIRFQPWPNISNELARYPKRRIKTP